MKWLIYLAQQVGHLWLSTDGYEHLPSLRSVTLWPCAVSLLLHQFPAHQVWELVVNPSLQGPS
jgi:hypothetical protein